MDLLVPAVRAVLSLALGPASGKLGLLVRPQDGVELGEGLGAGSVSEDGLGLGALIGVQVEEGGQPRHPIATAAWPGGRRGRSRWARRGGRR